MKLAATIVAVVGLLVVGFAIGRRAPGGHRPAEGAGASRILHYACPMHPTVRSDAPGTAPCCGMALEPVTADGFASAGASKPGTVAISPELRQLQGVRVGVVERTAGKQPLRLFGRVVPDETRVHVVDSAVEGTVREAFGATTGSFVKKGQLIGRIFSQDARTALQSYVSALDVLAREEQANREVGNRLPKGVTPNSAAQFAAERLRAFGVSNQQIDELRRTNQIPVFIDFRSPVDGVVIARDFTPGDRVDPGMECFRIANLDRVWVVADVQPGDVALVRPGTAARVALPGHAAPFTGVVSEVPPRFDAESQTLKVRIEVANPAGELRPDMFVDVELEAERPEAITVPAEAIVDAGVRKAVFVEVGEGRFEPRLVETGWRAGGLAEIRRGLAEGERIVVSGTFMVDSESQLRAAAAGEPAAAPQPATAAAAKPIDPICGMTVDPAKAQAAGRTHVHDGETYYFCSDGCREAFAKDPARTARHDSQDALPHGMQ